MKKYCYYIVITLFVSIAFYLPAKAQNQEVLSAYWMGNIKIDSGNEIRIAYHIRQAADNTLEATLDVPDQNAYGIPVSQIELNEDRLKMKSAAAGIVYEGIFKPEEGRIEGVLIQGDTTRLCLVAIDLNSLEGIWMGPMKIEGGEEIRTVFEISKDESGGYAAEFGIPEQDAMGIAVEKVDFDQKNLDIELLRYGIRYEGIMGEKGLSISGHFIQGDTVDLELVRYGSMPDLTIEKVVVERPQTPVGPYPYLEEEIVFENTHAGVKLAGTLTLPKSDIPCPAAILIHGSGPNDRNGTFAGTFHLLADHLSRQGIAVLRFDKRGAGASTGVYGQATTHDFASDVKAGMEFLKQDPRIDPGQIGLIGHSEGGVIAPMVASQYGDVAYMVLMAGLGQTFGEAAAYMRTEYAYSIGKTESEAAVLEDWYTRFYEIARVEDDTTLRKRRTLKAYQDLPEADKKIIAWADEDIIREVKGTYWTWFHEALRLEPGKYLSSSACPTLAVTGEKDRQANPSQNLPLIEKYLREGLCEDYQVKEMPGLNHLFQTAETGAVSEYEKISEIMAPFALSTVSDWIKGRVDP